MDLLTRAAFKTITMTHNTELITDDNGIEILASYYYEDADNVELKSVEVIIAGIGIDILPNMNNRQKDKVIDSLQMVA